MGYHVYWKDLPIELLQLIAERIKYLDDFMRFSVTCRSWNSATFELRDKKPWLPFKYPRLLLAEDTGLDLTAVKYPKPFDQTREIDVNKNISSTRGLFSLATQKIYILDLPEATDKLILGTNKGWLVTLSKDLELNLLHPLLREQIELPPMHTLPTRMGYDDDFCIQHEYIWFIRKVVMSSEIPTKRAFQNQDTNHLPMIMAIYEQGDLASARLGDKLWTKVEIPDFPSGVQLEDIPSDFPYFYLFQDILYHKEKFYAITFRGEVFMCDIDNDHQKGTMITSVPIEKKAWDLCYLIESLSGNHIWVVLRIVESFAEPPIPRELVYYTSNFLVLKLEVHYSNSNDAITSCTWTEQVKDLGNEALFIGRAPSMSIAPSEFIKPNNIYFTDDNVNSFGISE